MQPPGGAVLWCFSCTLSSPPTPYDFSLQSRTKTQRGGRSKARHLCFFPLSLNLSLSHLSWCAIQKFSATIKLNVSWANPCNIIPSRSSVETTLAVNRGGRYLVTTHTLYSSVRKRNVRWRRLLFVLLLLLLLQLLLAVCVGTLGMENCHSRDLGSCYHADGILIEMEVFFVFFSSFMET